MCKWNTAIVFGAQTARRPGRPDRGYAGIRRVPTGHAAFADDTRRYTSRPLHGCNHLRDVQEPMIAINRYRVSKASSVPQIDANGRKMSKECGCGAFFEVVCNKHQPAFRHA
jgi:hypothetical protein